MKYKRKKDRLKQLKIMLKEEDYAEKNRILREILNDCKSDLNERKRLHDERIKRCEESEVLCKKYVEEDLRFPKAYYEKSRKINNGKFRRGK